MPTPAWAYGRQQAGKMLPFRRSVPSILEKDRPLDWITNAAPTYGPCGRDLGFLSSCKVLTWIVYADQICIPTEQSGM